MAFDWQVDQTLLAALEAVSEEALGSRNWQARPCSCCRFACVSLLQSCIYGLGFLNVPIACTTL